MRLILVLKQCYADLRCCLHNLVVVVWKMKEDEEQIVVVVVVEIRVRGWKREKSEEFLQIVVAAVVEREKVSEERGEGER